nr:EOG090X04LH [Cyclestheria hislopi]
MKHKELYPNDPLLALPFDSLWDFLPKKMTGQTFIGYDLATLTWSFFKQGILKQILTEGERYIMTIFSVLTFAEQGVYDIVNNLGSMAARFLLLPIEESGYFYFAQMVRRDIPLENQPREDVEKVTKVFHTLLRGLSLLGSIIMVFGFSYSHLILWIYGGRTLTDGAGPLLLRVHCACVYLLAVNGITEAYVFAAMSQEQLNRYNHFMVGLSIVFLILSWLLSRLLGSIGFILANCANMALRIAHSVWFIHRQYVTVSSSPLYGLLQSRIEVAALVISFIVTATSEVIIYPWSATLHVIIGGICGLGVLGAIFYTEPDLLKLVIHAVKKRLGKSD